MARKQAVKTSAATATQQDTSTSTEQVVSVKQSTEIVQTLIHGSISSLAFIRELFPETCFVDQFYAAINSHWSYEKYAAAIREKADTGKKGLRGYSIKALKRGHSTRADRLLDWLEKGAFDALRRGFLRSLQLSIVENPSRLSNVLELYTFTFRYTNTNQETGSGTLSDVEMTGPRGNKVTIRKARSAMNDLVRSLVQLCGTMPALPEKRYLKMHLFYTEDCPKDYEPPGFEASVDNSISFPDTDWEKLTTRCGETNAGFHKVCLKVSHLSLDSAVDDDNQDSEEVTALSNNLTYGRLGSRLDDIDITPEASSPGNEGSQKQNQAGSSYSVEGVEAKTSRQDSAPLPQNSQPESESGKRRPHFNISSPSTTDSPEVDLDLPSRLGGQQPLHVNQTFTPRRASGQMENTVTPEVNSTPNPPTEAGSTTTPSFRPEDLRTRERLQQMLQPSGLHDDTQDTQQQEGSIQGSENQYSFPGQTLALQLSQKKMQQLESRRSILLPPRRTTSLIRRGSDSVGASGTVDKINCQCGWSEEEDDMINCSFCDTWQHIHCYGYRGSDDPRIPTVHACYQCLLQGSEDAVLRELRGLALHRRGIHLLEARSFDSDRQFASALRKHWFGSIEGSSELTKPDSDVPTTSRFVHHLRKEGFLVPILGPPKKSLGGKPRISLSKSEANVRRVMEAYFDPMSKIAHHFELPPSPKVAFQPTMMTTQKSVQADDTGESSPADSQSRRYPLRSRNSGISKEEAREASTATVLRKRGRELSDAADASTPKRQMKSSATMELLDLGDMVTPSSARPSRV